MCNWSLGNRGTRVRPDLPGSLAWLKNREIISTPELLIAAFVLAVLLSAGSRFTITVFFVSFHFV
jgi:hypothetical protein